MKSKAFLAAALLLAGPAMADSPIERMNAPMVDKEDGEFFVQAAQAGLAEVATGKLAASRAKDPEIKAFAEKMVTDHKKANDELQVLASKKGVTLPTETDAEHRQALEELKHKTGGDFDAAYIDLMQEDHRDAVDLFQEAAEDAKDPELKRFAQKTLPKLKHHKDMADGLGKRASR